MSFPCTGCGICCMRAGRAVLAARELIAAGEFENNPYVNEVADFPFSFDKHGRCEKLADDHTCMVYENRPDICSVDKTYEKYHTTGSMTREQYYKKGIDACNEMINEMGFDKKYLING